MKGAVFFITIFLLFLLFWTATRTVESSGCINVNAAPKEELMRIVHIGESRAEQIIALRQEKLFDSLDDLERVTGIGPLLLDEIKNQGLACLTEQQARPAEETRSDLKTIDVNTASEEELQKITGIGPVLAQRIIEARPFYSLDELINVSRIGPETLKNIKEQGLAWIDPDLIPAEAVNREAPQNNSVRYKMTGKGPFSKSLPVILTVFALAGLSGGIILTLKKSLKIS